MSRSRIPDCARSPARAGGRKAPSIRFSVTDSLREQPPALRHEGDAEIDDRLGRQAHQLVARAVDLGGDAPGGRPHHAHDAFHQGALAVAVGAEQRDRFAPRRPSPTRRAARAPRRSRRSRSRSVRLLAKVGALHFGVADHFVRQRRRRSCARPPARPGAALKCMTARMMCSIMMIVTPLIVQVQQQGQDVVHFAGATGRPSPRRRSAACGSAAMARASSSLRISICVRSRRQFVGAAGKPHHLQQLRAAGVDIDAAQATGVHHVFDRDRAGSRATVRLRNGRGNWKLRARPSRVRSVRRQPVQHAGRRSARCPASLRNVPRQAVDQRALARAVRADQPDPLAGAAPQGRSRPARRSRRTAWRARSLPAAPAHGRIPFMGVPARAGADRARAPVETEPADDPLRRRDHEADQHQPDDQQVDARTRSSPWRPAAPCPAAPRRSAVRASSRCRRSAAWRSCSPHRPG